MRNLWCSSTVWLQHRYEWGKGSVVLQCSSAAINTCEWKGLWCSSTVWLLSTQTWVSVKAPSRANMNGRPNTENCSWLVYITDPGEESGILWNSPDNGSLCYATYTSGHLGYMRIICYWDPSCSCCLSLTTNEVFSQWLHVSISILQQL